MAGRQRRAAILRSDSGSESSPEPATERRRPPAARQWGRASRRAAISGRNPSPPVANQGSLPRALRRDTVQTSANRPEGAHNELGEHSLRPRKRSLDTLPRREPLAKTNELIRAPQVRLIDELGEQVGIKELDEALAYAYSRDLDLVEISPGADPPVARVMNFGKYRYELEQKAKLARRNQSQIVIKEVRLRPKIGIHDYQTKRNRALHFLQHREKVKVVVLFRGREREHPERGTTLLERFAEDVAEFGRAESKPLHEGRSVSMMISPVGGTK
jgi:translation initiation factor IF-3